MDAKLTHPLQPPVTASAEPKAAADESAGSIDKVRDILFGGQMREYERRFARLEERLLQETIELREDVRKRLGAVEEFAKQEAASLADRLKTERDERNDADKDLARAARESATAFEKKTGQIEDHIGRIQRELRQQMLELQQRMTDELRQKIDDVLARLGQEATDLRTDKADRATLAALLTDMAMRLTTDLSIPGIDNGRHG